jgi:predicted dehydrogenase
MGEKLKFGIVGAGAIAQVYAQAFQKCKSAVVAGVADVRREAANALAEGLHCASYDSHESMATNAELDAVVVCTPPNTHAPICLDLLPRGLHVLCEKPLSIDSTSAKTMLAMAKDSGVRLTMASKFRYVDDVVKAKSIVASGVLGKIILFENVFASRVDMSSRWNSDLRSSGGGVLIDNGTHSVDVMRYFLGPLAEVQVVEGIRVQGLPVEETVRIFVRSVEGAMGSVDLSWSINKEVDSYINVYGSDGTVSVGWKESKYRYTSAGDWTVFGRGYDKIQALRSQIENFSRAILFDEPLLITPEDSLASVEVVEAAYAALQRNRWTPINGKRTTGELITRLAGRNSKMA